MPERFGFNPKNEEEELKPVVVDPELSWNPENETAIKGLFASLGWALGAPISESLKPVLAKVALDYIPGTPHQNQIEDFVRENAGYLSLVGQKLIKGGIGNDPFRDPDAGYVRELLEKMIELGAK